MRLTGLYRDSSKLAWLVVFALLFVAAPSWSAEDDTTDVRYELIKNGKELLRFDKTTGELARMERNEDGTISWVPIPVRKGNAVVTKAKEPKPAPTIAPDEAATAHVYCDPHRTPFLEGLRDD